MKIRTGELSECTSGCARCVTADFSPIDTVVTWADGDNLPKSVVLGLVDDGVGEDRERLTVQLSIDGGTASLAAPSTLPVTIYDDDAGVFADGFEGPGSL